MQSIALDAHGGEMGIPINSRRLCGGGGVSQNMTSQTDLTLSIIPNACVLSSGGNFFRTILEFSFNHSVCGSQNFSIVSYGNMSVCYTLLLYQCDVCQITKQVRLIPLMKRESKLALSFLKCFPPKQPLRAIPSQTCEKCFTRMYNFRYLVNDYLLSQKLLAMHQTTPTTEEEISYPQIIGDTAAANVDVLPEGVSNVEMQQVGENVAQEESQECMNDYSCTCQSCQNKYGCLPLLLKGIEEQSKGPSLDQQPSTSSSQQESQQATTRRIMSCQFCQKSFTHKGDFNKHLRKHTKEQPYACPVCSKKFAHSSNLQRHRRLHSGQRPFVCAKCGKSFTRKDKLECHRKSRSCSD